MVFHSEPSIAAAVLKCAVKPVAGLNASTLVPAVHTVPFPTASISHSHLVGELIDLAGLARYRDEVRLARALAHDGHKVTLFHVA